MLQSQYIDMAKLDQIPYDKIADVGHNRSLQRMNWNREEIMLWKCWVSF